MAEVCRTFGVRRLELFGFAATGALEEETSDLEVIANYPDRSVGYADRYIAFADA